jgi:2-polyprenyl-6-methoxyphenol hydroxylase-like FAD-dependent oxidoreductase
LTDQTILDVAIVGYGPVGQTLSILLGERGYDVAVFDRWPSLYPLPRAVFHDHEIRRVFQAMGIEKEVEAISQPSATYQWFNADWKTLVEIDWSAESISDGPVGYLFNQPSLEAVLHNKAKSLPNVSVNQGWQAVELRQLAEYCEVTLAQSSLENGSWVATGKRHTVRARYVVGADGANSFVRKSLGIAFENLGFQEDWLVIDVKPNEGVKLDVPDIGQWCNPARPAAPATGAGNSCGCRMRRWRTCRSPRRSGNCCLPGSDLNRRLWYGTRSTRSVR